MTLYDLIIKRRTIRRFQQKPVPEELLMNCVNAARLAPTARNLQPLEFIIIDEPGTVAQVFETAHWGGFATMGKIEKGKRAMAYILIILNKQIRDSGYDQDVGIAAENIVLTALDVDVGCCMMRAVGWEKLKEILTIPETHEPVLLVAMGYPDESPVAEDSEEEMQYYQDAVGVIHVPKRKMKDVVHRNKF